MDHMTPYAGEIIFALLLVFAVIVLEICRELHFFKVTRYQIKSKKLSGMKEDAVILFLSDLHNREYGKHNSRLLRAVKKESPDLILIGGDMLVGKENAACDTALAFVRRLTESCPVIYANGNHEQRMKEKPKNYRSSYAEYKRELEKAGVLFLENKSCRISLKEKTFHIYGLELPGSSYKKFQKAQITRTAIENMIGNPDGYSVLLAHNPAYADAYLAWGADLILCGHLHGGLVRLPLVGGLVTPQGFLFPKYSGEMTREGEQTVIVSRGLGTHTVNIRFLNTPEIVSVRLSAEKDGGQQRF